MAAFDEIEMTDKLNMAEGESSEPNNSDKDCEIEWVASDAPKVSTAFGIVGMSKESFNEINQYSESSDSEFSCGKIIPTVSERIQKSPKTSFDEQIMNFSAVNSGSKTTLGENMGVDKFCKNEVSKNIKNKEKDIASDSALQKMRILLEAYTESSSSSEMQLSPPIETSSSSQPDNSTVRTDFKNAICKEVTELPEIIVEENHSTVCLKPATPEETKPSIPEISIPVDENIISSSTSQTVADNITAQAIIGPAFPPSLPEASVQPSLTESQPEVKVEQAEQQPELPPQPVPVIPPAPRKRGRPRKQVLPSPVPVVEWPPGQEPKFEVPKEEKRTPRTERRQAKRRKLDDGENKEEKKKQRSSQATQKKKKRSTYVPKKKLASQRKKHSEMENIQNFEEETRMSASEGPTGFSSRSGALGDESQSGSMTTEGHTKSSINKKGRMEVGTEGCKPVTVQQIVEYYWPPPSSLPYGEKSDALMIQEQICEYLGCKSFKRKYPSIKRRPVDMEERTYLQENGYVSENMCDMGLTAVLAADIMEIMYNDFPHKFEEYRKYSREKKVKEQRALREKQAAERADMDPKKEALESAQSWNSELNKTRREKRATCFDLQTFTVHFPVNSFKRISLGKPGNYPIALIPGQNTDYYKRYTSNELKYFPLNTVLYGPLRPNERHLQLPSGSDGSQSEIDDSSSSDESSSSSSEETQDTEETNSTVEDEGGEVKNEKVKNEKPVEVEEKETPKVVKSTPKTPKGRGRGKANPPDPNQPKKRLGRPPKIKVPVVEVKSLDGEETTETKKEEKVDISSRVIIHTCKMCHEEETKNKNGEFESFIECAQCNGKIHPSCIDLTPDMIPKISSYGWQCTDCKSCVKCGQSSNEDKMIFCDQCDRGYHIFCVGLSEVPSGNYICVVCKPSTPMSEGPSLPGAKDVKVEVKEEENSDTVQVKMEEGISEKS